MNKLHEKQVYDKNNQPDLYCKVKSENSLQAAHDWQKEINIDGKRDTNYQ